MRQLKFRGKSINGDFHYGLLSKSEGIKGYQPSKGYYISNSKGMPWAYQVIPETVGQYTGLTDSKGIEIYEGDILSDWVKTDEGTIQSKNQVFWNEFTGSWHLDESLKQDKTYSTELWKCLNDFKYEVTGNIYES